MHIPDNYLSPSTCALLGAAMIPVWKKASFRVKEEMTKKEIPLLSIGAAFSFLIMMFNLPLPGGTTGHAVGATLVAILLGPYAAVISITIALVIQALFFGDGGILALGANTFNMAFVMPFVGYYIFKIINGSGENKMRTYLATFLAGYISLNISALFTAIEFGIQPLLFKDLSGLPLYCPYPISVAIPAMVIPHILVAGFVEGIVTTLVYTYIKNVSPDMIYKKDNLKLNPLYGLLIFMVMLSPLGLLASGTAWGEWGIEEISSMTGYIPKSMEKGFNFQSLMPDYAIFGTSDVVGYILSAIIGILLIFISFKIINKLRKLHI